VNYGPRTEGKQRRLNSIVWCGWLCWALSCFASLI